MAWVENLGSDALEAALTAHLADEFDAKHGGGKTGAAGIRASPRAMAKLRKAVKRAKEVLSANSEAPVIVEELHNDVDFRASVTRETFEELAGGAGGRAAGSAGDRQRGRQTAYAALAVGGRARSVKCGGGRRPSWGGRLVVTTLSLSLSFSHRGGLPAGSFFTRAAAPLVKLLERNNVTVADIAAVELLGGGSRVPRLKAALSEALGGRALDMCARCGSAC